MVETTAKYRHLVGKILRGAGNAYQLGQPLAGAKFTATATILAASSDALHILDPVEGVTDSSAQLRDAVTGEDGIWLLPTDDPSLGHIDWVWRARITAPSLERPVEFDLSIPSGTSDLNIADLAPSIVSPGGTTLFWIYEGETPPSNPKVGMVWHDTTDPYRTLVKTWI